jgi:metal-dependent amidase/aminoacylase/carboxypeptidase family protein
LKYEEFKTAEKIVSLLKSLNVYEIHENVGKTGVVAILKGAQ